VSSGEEKSPEEMSAPDGGGSRARDGSESFDVFLSYNGLDRGRVERIAEKLRRAGLEPWFDRWCLTRLGPGTQEVAGSSRRLRRNLCNRALCCPSRRRIEADYTDFRSRRPRGRVSTVTTRRRPTGSRGQLSRTRRPTPGCRSKSRPRRSNQGRGLRLPGGRPLR
jgi:hypothetical protein